VNAGTLRELSIRLKGALWRQEQAARLATVEAWTVANLTRAKKVPSLETLLRAHDSVRPPQSPAAVAAAVQHWAAMNGIKAEPFEGPVN
jgi:hypothetical protein